MVYERGRIHFRVDDSFPYDFSQMSEEEALQTVEVLEKDKDLRFIRFFFPDILGNINDFFIPFYELKSACEKGKGFDGSSVKGMTRIEESDLIFKPDLRTLRVLPFVYEGKTKGLFWRNAICFGDILHPDGRPYEGDSRYILKRTLEKLKEYDATNFYVGVEPEFFLIDDLEKPEMLDKGRYFRGGSFGDLRSEVQILFWYMGIKTEYDHHEVAHSQHEIDLRYDDALNTADILFLFKYLVKKLARENGVYASFAPKPFFKENGSGLHTHMSVWKGEKNLFYDEEDSLGLSSFGYFFLSGIMKYLPEIMLTTNPSLNSYERLVPGYEAPTLLAMDVGNRSTCVRSPSFGNDNGSKRIELRSLDPSCNLYLALSTILLAGMKGVEEKEKSVVIVDRDLFQMSEKERKDRGIEEMPGSLESAYEWAKKSVFLNEAVGEHLKNILVMETRSELVRYEQALREFTDKRGKQNLTKDDLLQFNIEYSRKFVI